MKFQNIITHGSKVMLCIRKGDEPTIRQARSNMPKNWVENHQMIITAK